MEPRSQTLPDLLDEMASAHADRPFLIYQKDRLSYAEFHAEVRKTAKGLISIGVRPGDKVAIWMGNQTEWLLLVFATSLIGATFVGLNTWWRAKELEHALNLADVDVLIFTRRYINADYMAVVGELGDLSVAAPRLRTCVCLGDAEAAGGILDYRAMLAGADTVDDAVLDDRQSRVKPEDIALILFTSGSSARPKAVQNEHRNLIKNLFQIGERLHLSTSDRIHLSISLFWGFGIANAVFAVFTHGASLVLQHRFDAAEALKLIEEERCTGLYATPNIALALKQHPDRAARNLSSLRTGLGMPAATGLMIDLGAKQACSLYGLTECYGNSAVSDANEPEAIRRFTCGRPLRDTEIKIADPITHRALASGETGEICLRGFVMPGYYKGAQETADATDGEGYFLTGDLGVIDKDGYLHFRGRLKEMIKSGGINVSPAEVEDNLRSHAAVEQALVVGIPDQTLDEMVVAALVLKPGADANEADLAAHCRKHLANYKIPRRFVFLEMSQVPLTETGKPDKRTLQRTLAQAPHAV